MDTKQQRVANLKPCTLLWSKNLRYHCNWLKKIESVWYLLIHCTSFAASDSETRAADLLISLLDRFPPVGMPHCLITSLSLEESDMVSVREDGVEWSNGEKSWKEEEYV